MTSQFGTLWRDAYPKMEAAFGEADGFRLEPQRPASDINGKPSFDPTRPIVAFTAIYDAEPTSLQMDGRGRAGSWSEPVVGALPRLDAAAATFIVPPRLGDRIIRLLTSETFIIAEIRPSDQGRIALHLNRA